MLHLDGFADVGERATDHVSESVEPHHLLHQNCVHTLRGGDIVHQHMVC